MNLIAIKVGEVWAILSGVFTDDEFENLPYVSQYGKLPPDFQSLRYNDCEDAETPAGMIDGTDNITAFAALQEALRVRAAAS